MNRNGIISELEQYIRKQFNVAQTDTRFGPNAPLFDHGYVDSVGVIELLAFVQDTYGVYIPDEELTSDDFSTIDGIASVIVRLAQPGRSKR